MEKGKRIKNFAPLLAVLLVAVCAAVSLRQHRAPVNAQEADAELSMTAEPDGKLNPAGEPEPNEEPDLAASMSPTGEPISTAAASPSPTAQPSPTEIPSPTGEPVSTAAASPSPTAEPSPTEIPSPTAEPVSTAAASPNPTAEPSPTAQPSPTEIPSPTGEPVSTAAASPSPTAEPEPGEEPAEPAGNRYQDGIYTVTVNCSPDEYYDFEPYRLTVSITVREDSITEISEVEGDGDPGNKSFISRAVKGTAKYPGVAEQITAKGLPEGIDAVSGATCTSNAIVEACKKALENAENK